MKKNNFIENCTGVILAGGENKRMPVLKAFIEVEGKKIIERNLSILKQLFPEVHIITNQPELYVHSGVPMFGDVQDVRGPMTGILTALLNSSHDWIFVSACDMPYIDPGLIRFMADERFNPACLSIMNTRQKDGIIARHASDIYDIIVPVVNQRAEPLFACYSKRVMHSLEEFITAGRKSIKNFLLNHDKRVKYISPEDMKGADPEMRSFINLNTPEDVDLYLGEKDKLRFKESLCRTGKQAEGG